MLTVMSAITSRRKHLRSASEALSGTHSDLGATRSTPLGDSRLLQRPLACEFGEARLKYPPPPPAFSSSTSPQRRNSPLPPLQSTNPQWRLSFFLADGATPLNRAEADLREVPEDVQDEERVEVPHEPQRVRRRGGGRGGGGGGSRGNEGRQCELSCCTCLFCRVLSRN